MSDDRSRGISLRTKRKPNNNRKQISGPIPSTDGPRSAGGKSSAGVPPPRPTASGKTSDLVKRRYSTRFTNLPADYDATVPPIPSIPSIPSQYVGQGDLGRGKSPARGQGLAPDLKALQDPSLRPEQYVAGILSDASEQDINEYQRELQKMRNRTSTDLQQNVYQNRTQFIKISKEAEKLKAEMRSLRNLMSELKTNTTALRVSSSTTGSEPSNLDEGFPTTLSKRDKRSSVADRTALWNSQLQALWKHVEGSQKFLPAAPGRHVVQDAGVWRELDNATWRSGRSMQLILLNDHLLVASRRKRRVEGGSESRHLVADRCWPLLDIEVVDLAGVSGSASAKSKIADAIMVKGVGSESYTYRLEKADSSEKTTLLLNYRKAVEELRRGLRSEIETNNKAKETLNYFASRDPGLLKKADLLETLSDKDRSNVLIEVDGKQQNLRWVDGQVDELDIDIALQHFDVAVERVEKLKFLAKKLKSHAIARDFINFKIEERASKLAAMITRELVEYHDKLSKIKVYTAWLTRLGFEDRAREAYLEARTHIIQKRSRQCIFEGNLPQYIWEVSFVYFTIIRNTVMHFQSCFPTPTMSACIKWAKEQVDDFNVILTRQLSSAEHGGPVWTECMNQAYEHAKMLSTVGLDFKNLIGREVEGSVSPGEPQGLGLM